MSLFLNRTSFHSLEAKRKSLGKVVRPIVVTQSMPARLADIQLCELSQLMIRLCQSSVPEPVCGRMVAVLKPLEQMGYLTLDCPQPGSVGEPFTATRACLPHQLRHFFWRVWLPTYYQQTSQPGRERRLATQKPSLCTVVLELPEKYPSLQDVLFDLSLLIEATGVAEIVHIESGNAALHLSAIETEVKP